MAAGEVTPKKEDLVDEGKPEIASPRGAVGERHVRVGRARNPSGQNSAVPTGSDEATGDGKHRHGVEDRELAVKFIGTKGRRPLLSRVRGFKSAKDGAAKLQKYGASDWREWKPLPCTVPTSQYDKIVSRVMSWPKGEYLQSTDAQDTIHLFFKDTEGNLKEYATIYSDADTARLPNTATFSKTETGKSCTLF